MDRTRYDPLYDLFSTVGVIIPRTLKPHFPVARDFTLLNGKFGHYSGFTADVVHHITKTWSEINSGQCKSFILMMY